MMFGSGPPVGLTMPQMMSPAGGAGLFDSYGMYTEQARPQPPNVDDLRAEFTRLEERFQVRDDAILEHRRRLDDFTSADNQARTVRNVKKTARWFDDWVLKISIPATIIERGKAQLAEGTPSIQLGGFPNGPQVRDLARLHQGWLKKYRHKVDKGWRRSGKSSDLMTAAWEYLLRDGHCYLYQMVDPEDETVPVRSRLWDPVTVRPVFTDDGMVRCYRKVKLTVEEVRSQYGAELYPEVEEPSETRELICYYDDVWLACFANDVNEYLKPPVEHGLGRVPVKAAFVGGREGVTEEDKPEAVERDRGRGALWDVSSEIEAVSRLMWAATIHVIKEVDPPVKIKEKADSEPIDVKTHPGARIHMETEGEDVGYLINPAALPQLTALLDRYIANIQARTFVVDQSKTFASGFDRLAANDKEQVFFRPYVKAACYLLEDEAASAFQIYKMAGATCTIADFGPDEEQEAAQFMPAMVPDEIQVEVTFRNLRVSDKLQIGTVAAQLVKSGLYGPRTVLRDFMGEDDPDGVIDEARSEMMRQNPIAIQAEAPIVAVKQLMSRAEAEERQGNRELALLYRMQAQNVAQTILPPPPQGPPGMPPGGQGGPPGPGGMPGGGQIPPELLQAMMAQQGGNAGQFGPEAGGGMPTGVPPWAMPPEAAGFGAGDMGAVPGVVGGMPAGPGMPGGM